MRYTSSCRRLSSLTTILTCALSNQRAFRPSSRTVFYRPDAGSRWLASVVVCLLARYPLLFRLGSACVVLSIHILSSRIYVQRMQQIPLRPCCFAHVHHHNMIPSNRHKIFLFPQPKTKRKGPPPPPESSLEPGAGTKKNSKLSKSFRLLLLRPPSWEPFTWVLPVVWQLPQGLVRMARSSPPVGLCHNILVRVNIIFETMTGNCW